MNYTTIGQGKELLALGLKPETADMCYLSQTRGVTYFSRPTIKGKDVEQYYSTSFPCWSGLALISLMPKYIGDFKLIVSSNEVSYYDIDFDTENPYLYCFADDLMSAIITMTKFLLKKKIL